MGLGTIVPLWYIARVSKTAENCGGRYRTRTCDILGVNDCDRRQIKRLAAVAYRDCRRIGPFRSACVPPLGTKRTSATDRNPEGGNRETGRRAKHESRVAKPCAQTLGGIGRE
jgi:hypothetical protein